MPIYEYLCQDCKQIFEEWQQDYEERDIPCPVCGGKSSRIISNSNFVLKGGGWYANGYSSTGGGGADKPAQSGSAETAKPAAPAAKTTPAATTHS